MGWQAEAVRIPPPPSGERFMPLPRDLRGGKGARLSSRQNSTKKSGGLNKAEYERLIHLVSQNRFLYDATCIIMTCTFFESFLNDIVHQEPVRSFMFSSKKKD